MEQLKLFSFDDPIPGECVHELRVVEVGRKLKSLCGQMQCWTNCREWGHCTSDGRIHRQTASDDE
jgi:hypothetical protein